ncbi:MAG: DPP IV N-terminal domain-containing protein [Granulosicoccus sp.]
MKSRFATFLKLTIIVFAGNASASCSASGEGDEVDVELERRDGAERLGIELSGSLQNPAFILGGDAIVFTRFRDGYNRGVSDLFVYDIETGELSTLLADGNGSVNLPGSVWNEESNTVVFSSDRGEHDEIYIVSDTGSAGEETQITNRPNRQSYEPSFSSDGQWVVFESHDIDVEGNGVITKYRVDGNSDYVDLTALDGDARQPNWSPTGDRILYQQQDEGRWVIWSMDADGDDKTKITNVGESSTDAVYSYDGQWVFYSSENNDVELSNIYRVFTGGGESTRISSYAGYDGAPSVSPDGVTLVFESYAGDPDGSSGTTLWLMDMDDASAAHWR